ncbi:hypothetical protein FRX31_003637 [Thalictrum thalictroides]|uniref:Uncharacterized protein n=1 Tax=Thalictrum thalictroides TaxID=46969 RepID=A0A7J6XAE5_THATH|nr:hypothetical protein FRX31_003637 [Thalictrum thalictroides]
MRILRCVLILAFAILLKKVYCDSSNPLPNSPLSYLSSLPKPKPKASPFQVPATNTKLGNKVRPQAPAPAPPPSPSKVTSYLLAVQWPHGVCTGNSGVKCEINPVPAEFKIHGLWPQFPAADPPKKSTEIFGNQIANITSDLNNYWPNLKSKQQQVSINLKFWGAEWTKHGSLSEMGVLQYFQKTLELFESDIGKQLKAKLADEKITPSIYSTYQLVDIQAALKKINGNFSCTIICNQRNSNKKEQIQEIRFRFTNDFNKQDNLTPSRCTGPDVLLPALA